MAKSPRVKKLEKIIVALDTAYYKGDDCINIITGDVVTDNEYDTLRRELFDLSPKSKIFKTITASKAKVKSKIIHDPPMTSINKCNGTQEEKEKILFKWLMDCSVGSMLSPDQLITMERDKIKISFPTDWFSISYKHDGLALSLRYAKGDLITAGLRSKSGMDGIDVTDKTRFIKGIPWHLPNDFTGTIRGEVETFVSDFKRVSAEMERNGETPKKNPRAHTAGSMNKKTADEMRDRGLQFVAYNIIMENPPYTTEVERAEFATKTLGLNYVKTILFEPKWLQIFEDQHRRLDFMVDGIVLSVNYLSAQKDLGNSGNKDTGNPKGKLAWKFKDEVKITTVKDIVWQTGRTGNVTPVLIIDPIQLEGTTVTKCTAHNLGIIKNNKIGIGSKVEIIKSGKIIPKLHSVVKAMGKVAPPKNCPSCDNPLASAPGADGTEILECNNVNCPAHNIKTLNHYLKILGVKGIANSTINKLVEAGLVQKRSDFYKLTLGTLLNSGFTERTAILILARIWMVSSPEQEKDNVVLKNKLKNIQSITVPMDKFFASFGMDGAGKEVGRILSKKYRDFDKIRTLTKTEMEGIDGIGPVTANHVEAFFYSNEKEITELLNYVELEAPAGKSGVLDGKKFVLSGSMDMGKNYWRTEIENNGGEVKSSVSKKIDFVVAGPGSGSKSDKANELGITILEEEDLEKMLKG